MTTHNGEAPPVKPLGNRRLSANYLERLLINVLASRQEWLRRAVGGDPRRNVDDECGYNTNPGIRDYQDYYDRFEIAGKVNDVWPQLTWQIYPSIYEDEDETVITPFEQGVKDLPKQLTGGEESYCEDEDNTAINEVLRELDVLSGIGRYGALLYGFDDGLDLRYPVAGFTEVNSFSVGKDANDREAGTAYTPSMNRRHRYSLTINAEQTQGRRLNYLSAFSESQAEIVAWEMNRTSPRHGLPTMYRVTMADGASQAWGIGMPTSTEEVHWTRILHVPDKWHHASPSRVFAVPRMQPVLNRLYDLLKVYSADGEAWWKNAMAKLILEAVPDLQGDIDVDTSAVQDTMEKFGNGLQPWLLLAGLSAKTVAPAIADPSPHADTLLQAIAIKLDISMRSFMGSERGELASSQDQKRDNKKARGRQTGYATPRIVGPFYNRLINAGVLVRPSRFCVWWPEMSVMTETEEANIALVQTQTDAAYVAGNVASLIPPLDYLTRVRGFTAEEASTMLEAAREHHAETVEQDVEDRRREIDEGLAPDPQVEEIAEPAFNAAPEPEPEPKPVENAAPVPAPLPITSVPHREVTSIEERDRHGNFKRIIKDYLPLPEEPEGAP